MTASPRVGVDDGSGAKLVRSDAVLQHDRVVGGVPKRGGAEHSSKQGRCGEDEGQAVAHKLMLRWSDKGAQTYVARWVLPDFGLSRPSRTRPTCSARSVPQGSASAALGGQILERAENRFALLYHQGEDAGAVPVSGLRPFGQSGIVDETGELENVGAGDGKAGEVHRGHPSDPYRTSVRLQLATGWERGLAMNLRQLECVTDQLRESVAGSVVCDLRHRFPDARRISRRRGAGIRIRPRHKVASTRRSTSVSSPSSVSARTNVTQPIPSSPEQPRDARSAASPHPLPRRAPRHAIPYLTPGTSATFK